MCTSVVNLPFIIVNKLHIEWAKSAHRVGQNLVQGGSLCLATTQQPSVKKLPLGGAAALVPLQVSTHPLQLVVDV